MKAKPTKREGSRKSTTETLYDAWDALHEKTYMPHVTIARLVFRDENTRERLGISGDRSDGLDDWLQEARNFYNILLEDEALAAEMATRGIGLSRDKKELRYAPSACRHLPQWGRTLKIGRFSPPGATVYTDRK